MVFTPGSHRRSSGCVKNGCLISKYSFMSKTVFITGATSGIGEATAHRFANLEFQLILCGRNRERLIEMEKTSVKKQKFTRFVLMSVIKKLFLRLSKVCQNLFQILISSSTMQEMHTGSMPSKMQIWKIGI